MEDWELLAVLLGKGTKNKNIESLSREILYKCSGIAGLSNIEQESLFAVSGLGRAKISILLAAAEIANRLKIFKTTNKAMNFSETRRNLAEYLQYKTLQEKRECFFLATFTHNKSLIATRLIARGSLDEVGVHSRDLVKLMLDDGARYVLISHNHPNERCKPSSDDIYLFKKLAEILQPLEIILLDQWIFGIDGIYSCDENKKINPDEWYNPKNQNHTHTCEEGLRSPVCG